MASQSVVTGFRVRNLQPNNTTVGVRRPAGEGKAWGPGCGSRGEGQLRVWGGGEYRNLAKTSQSAMQEKPFSVGRTVM